MTYALAKDRNEAWLNRVWKEKPKMKSTLTIPIIDIGWETINYDSIGDGIRMAESGSRRMILAGQTPIWISFTDTDSFIDIIERIRPFVVERTASNIESAIGLLDQASFMTGVKCEYIILGKPAPMDVMNIPQYADMDL